MEKATKMQEKGHYKKLVFIAHIIKDERKSFNIW